MFLYTHNKTLRFRQLLIFCTLLVFAIIRNFCGHNRDMIFIQTTGHSTANSSSSLSNHQAKNEAEDRVIFDGALKVLSSSPRKCNSRCNWQLSSMKMNFMVYSVCMQKMITDYKYSAPQTTAKFLS